MEKCPFSQADLKGLEVKIKKIGYTVSKAENKQNTFAQAVNLLGQNDYSFSSIEEINELGATIQNVINRFYPKLANELTFNHINEYLTTSSTKVAEVPNQIDADEDVQERASSYLTKMYGNNEDIRSLADVLVYQNLVNYTLINRDKGYEIEDDTQLNQELQEYQKQLFSNVIDYLKNYSGVSGDVIAKLGTYNVFNKSDVDDVNDLAKIYLPLNMLAYHHKKGTAGNKVSKAFVDAYMSLVTLNNFDNYIRTKQGSYIDIKTNLIGTITDDSSKYFFKGMGARLRTGWESDEAKDKKGAVDETSDIIRAIADTMSMYKWGKETPVKGRVFDLNSLYYITNKIKSLIFEPSVKDIYFNTTFFSSEGYPEFAKYRNDISDLSFYDLLGLLDSNNMKYFPIIVELLNNEKFFNSFDVFRNTFYSGEKDLLQSLYKNIFDSNNNSFLSIYTKNPKTKRNFYSYLVKAMSDVDNSLFIECRRNEDGILEQTDLKDALSNTTKSALERTINGFNSKVNRSRYEGLNEKYNISYNEGLLKFNIDGNEVLFDPKTKETSINLKGTEYKVGNADLGGKELWNTVKPFIADLLNQNFNNLGFNTALNDEFATNGVVQYKELFNVFNTAVSNLFNIYFSNVIAKDIRSSTELKKLKDSTFGDRKNKVRITAAGKAGIELNSTSTDDAKVLKKLAIAKDISNGKYASGLVKDGSGNAIASIVSRRLAGNVLPQFVQLASNPNSAILNFSLMQNTNLFKGIGYLRDFTDGYVAKNGIKFNASEFFDTAFIINYLGIKYKNEENAANRFTAIFPDAISDKSQLLHILLNLNTVIDGKLLKDYTSEDLKKLAKRELGNYYLKAYTNILYDFKLLSDFAASKGMPTLNPLTNFSEWNSVYGKEANNILHDLIYDYNQVNSSNPIKIIDQTHYFENGGLLQANRGYLAELLKNDSTFDFIKAFREMYPNAQPQDAYFERQSRLASELVKDGRHGTDNATFWKKQEARLLVDLMREGYKLDLTDDSGSVKPSTAIQQLFDYASNMGKPWTDTSLGRMILAKIKYPDSKVLDISSISDFRGLTYTKEVNGQPKLINYTSSDFDLYEYLNLNKATLEIHPELAAFNTLQYLFGEEYIISTVGTHYNHDGKKSVNSDDFDVEEAFRFAAARKRAVSQTAIVHSFLRNSLDGVQNQYKVATIKDIVAAACNIQGMEELNVKPFDGATYVEPSQVWLENNSLKADVAGVDKKTFAHFYDARTGTGGIIKTACFGITNARVRASAYVGNTGWQFYKIMSKLMMDHRWTLDNVPYDADITKDFFGDKIKYKTIFFEGSNDFFEGVEFEKGAYYQVVGDIIKTSLPNTYQLQVAKVDKYGKYADINNDGTPKTITINKVVDTNYKLWLMFGGERSLELNEDGILEPSEVSIENLVNAEIHVGELKSTYVPGQTLTAEDVHQPLKHSSIQYIITAGAIKQGASNINSNKAFYDPNYKLNTFTIDATNIGIQLNAEHHADNSTLSLMTQVANALSARNFMTEEANEVYRALESITKYAISDFTDELGRVLNRNDKKFKDSLVSIIIDSMKNSPSREGNLIASMAENLIARANNGEKITFDKVNKDLAFSIPAVYKKVTSILSSAFTKKGIKFKFEGILAVINPSYSIYKLYGGRLSNSFHDYDDILELQKTVYDKQPIESISDLKIGHRYKAIPIDVFKSVGIPEDAPIIDLTETPNDLTAPRRYWEAKELYGSGYIFIEDITQGSDLDSYSFTFKGDDNNTYNMYDLGIIQACFNYSEVKQALANIAAAQTLKNARLQSKDFDGAKEIEAVIDSNIIAIKKFSDKYGFPLPARPQDLTEKYLYRLLQKQLFAVGTGEYDSVNVMIKDKNGVRAKRVKVVKDSLKIRPYGVIMPKIYQTLFGLKKGDSVNVIKNDNNFFLRRFIDNWNTIDSQNYHIALKRVNGDHIYLMHKNHANTDKLDPQDIEYYYEGDKLYRIDKAGNKLHRLSSENDKVYIAENGKEVIITDNPWFYIDSFSYNTIQFSDFAIESDYFEELFNPILQSDSKNVEQFLELFDDSIDYKSQLLNFNKVTKEDLKSILSNPEAVSDPILKGIYKQGREMHTSFLQSLRVLAARIPAQCMQSFMAMEVAEFDDSGLNSAYVSHFQFWLQGSDLDIDKVSLLGYAFDKDGRFVGWSPYFNLESEELLNESFKLPFPTGKKVEVVYTEDEGLLAKTQDSFSAYIDSKGFNWTLSKSTNDIAKKDLIGYLADFLRSVNKNEGKIYVKPGTDTKNLEKLINRHNLYIQKPQREKMAKNFVSVYMYKISSDPACLIQSQSPIDEPVTILKDKGKTSETEAYDKYDMAGNFMAVVKGLRKNQISKDCVGISASGMKSMEGFMHYYGKRLLEAPNVEQLELISNVNVCGYNLKMLANTYTSDSQMSRLLAKSIDMNEPEAVRQGFAKLYDILHNLDQDTDALLSNSGVLGAAVDNAKDPILGKINGGSEMLPMYIYGIAMGIPFDDLANCMMSNTARLVNKLMAGNIIQDVDGFRKAEDAIKYIKNGPTKRDVPKGMYDILVELLELKNTDNTYKTIGEGVKNHMSNISEIINTLKDRVAKDTKIKKIAANRFIEKLQDWISYYNLATTETFTNENGVEFNALSSLEQLIYGANEFKRARPLYGLNKQLDTDTTKIINFVNNFNSIFTSRRKEMTEEQLNQPVTYYLNGEIVQSTAQEIFDSFKDSKGLISFDKFMDDLEYQKEIIAKYGAIKHSINILDAIMASPHYNGFMHAMKVDLETIRASVKFRKIEEYSPKVLKDNSYPTANDKTQLTKKMETFFDIVLNNKWLRSRKIVFNLPAGIHITDTKISTENEPFTLGTELGNAAFKSYMESEVIPNLKQGIIKGVEGKNLLLKNNAFIQSLQSIKLDRTESGNASYAYVSEINTMPRNPYEKDAFQKAKTAFDQLFTNKFIDYDGFPIGDLFFYYNTIMYNNTQGQSTLTTFFEDLFANKSSEVINNWTDFTYNTDLNSDLVEDVDFTYEDLLKFTAPKVRLDKAKGKYVRAKDFDLLTWELYKRKPSESEENEEGYDSDNSELLDDLGESDSSENDFYDEIGLGDEFSSEGNTTYKFTNKNYEKLIDSEYNTPWGVTEYSQYTPVDTNTTVTTIKLSNSEVSIENKKVSKIIFNGKSYSAKDLLSLRNDITEADLEIDTEIRTDGTITQDSYNKDILEALINKLFNPNC